MYWFVGPVGLHLVRSMSDLIANEYTDNEAEEQRGFQAGRSRIDSTFCIQQIIEKEAHLCL